MKPNTRRSLLLLGGLILLLLYLSGAFRQAHLVNTNMHETDQSAYMDYARAMAETDYRYTGGRNRMPVYPFLQSLIYQPGMADDSFFQRGKIFNIILSVLILAILLRIFLHYLPAFAAINLLLITAFTVFVFKAGYFQTELLFYLLNFGCFLLLNEMLHRPKRLMAVSAGILLGLAHLTKASIMPGLALFLVVGGLQALASFWRGSRPRLGERLMTIAVIPLFFLIMVFPYISTSKRVFGSYFYNVNTTFYIWYDSWEEAKRGTGAHNDQFQWPNLPADELPSARKYFQEHTPTQLTHRFLTGLAILLGNTVVYPFGYFKYFCLYLVVSLTVLLVNWRHTITLITSYPYLWLFNGLYFGAYLLLYAWYTPIAAGHRLMLAQFVPLLFLFSVLIFRLYSDQLVIKVQEKRFHLAFAFAMIIGILLAVDILWLIPHKVAVIYGGA